MQFLILPYTWQNRQLWLQYISLSQTTMISVKNCGHMASLNPVSRYQPQKMAKPITNFLSDIYDTSKSLFLRVIHFDKLVTNSLHYNECLSLPWYFRRKKIENVWNIWQSNHSVGPKWQLNYSQVNEESRTCFEISKRINISWSTAIPA